MNGTRAQSALWLLALINAANFADRMVLAALVEPIRRELGLTDSQIGLLTGIAFAFTYVVAGIPLARLADRFSRRTVIAGALLVWSAMTAACAGVHSFAQLFVARMAVAIGEAGCIPAAHSMISDLVPAPRRGSAMAIFSAGSPVGIFLGFTLAGLVSRAYGWRAAFVVLGLGGLLICAILLRWLREPPRQTRPAFVSTAETKGAETFSVALRELLAIRSFRWMVAGVTCGVFTLYGISQWMPSCISRVHSLAAGTAAATFGAIWGGAGLAGIIAGGVVVDRLSRRDLRWQAWLPAVAFPCSVPFLALAIFASDLSIVWPAVALGSFLTSAASGAQFAAPMMVIPANRRATASALAMFVASIIGIGGAPTLIGFASDALAVSFGTRSLQIAMLAVLPVTLLACLCYWRAGKSMTFSEVDALRADRANSLPLETQA